VNDSAPLLTRLISLVDTEHRMSIDDRLYALAMFYRAAILDLEAKTATGPFNDARRCGSDI